MTIALAVLVVAALALLIRWLREAEVLRRRLADSRVAWSDFRAKQLGLFYFPNSVAPGDFAVLDESGVRVIDFAKKPTRGKSGRQYVLTLIDQYGLGSWDLWLETNDPARFEAVRMQADWLVENLTVREDGVGVWLHHYDLGGAHQVKAPWVSGLAQGLSISLLMRAYQGSGHEPYREAAAQALRSFTIGVEDGGVRTLDDSGGAFYEEVPSRPPQHILNGHVYALLGIHDYFRVTGSPDAAELFEAGVRALSTHLSGYDAGYWSRYGLSQRRTLKNHYALSSPLYHRLHTDMMLVMHAITGDPAFEDLAKRWETCIGRPFDLAMRVVYAAFRDVVLVAKRFGLKL